MTWWTYSIIMTEKWYTGQHVYMVSLIISQGQHFMPLVTPNRFMCCVILPPEGRTHFCLHSTYTIWSWHKCEIHGKRRFQSQKQSLNPLARMFSSVTSSVLCILDWFMNYNLKWRFADLFPSIQLFFIMAVWGWGWFPIGRCLLSMITSKS